MITFQKKNKYGAKKTVFNNIKFDSIGESEYYKELLLKEKLIKGFKIIELQPKVYMTRCKILYKPDFLVSENGKEIYIDFKGMKTAVFNLKKRLWKKYGAGILQLVKKKGRNFYVFETITTEKIK